MVSLGFLGVWRVTHLVNAEDGPWDLVVWLRDRAGTSQFGRAMDCFKCLSMWVALPFSVALGRTWPRRLLLWPALSAAAIVLQQAMSGSSGEPLAAVVEEN